MIKIIKGGSYTFDDIKFYGAYLIDELVKVVDFEVKK